MQCAPTLPIHIRPTAELAREATGRTLRAFDELTGRPVVVKMVTRSAWMRSPEADSAAHEALEFSRMLAAVQHGGIASVSDFTAEDGAFVQVRDWVEGISLAEVFRRRLFMPCHEVRVLLNDVAAAVDHLSANGLEHGRLHPSNVFLCPDGRVVVTDAGWSRVQSAYSVGGMRRHAEDCGGIRGDIESLGALIYRALTGLATGPESDPYRLYHLPVTAREALYRAMTCGETRSARQFAKAFAPATHTDLWHVAWRPAAAIGLIATLATIGPDGISEQTTARPVRVQAVATQAVPVHVLPVIPERDQAPLSLVVRRHGPAALTNAAVASLFDLNSAQRDTIARVLATQSVQVHALVERAANGELVDTGFAMQELRNATNRRVMSVLDEAQRERWETLIGVSPAAGQPVL